MAASKPLSNIDLQNVLKIINAPDGSSAQDVATTAQVTAAQNFAKSRTNHTGTQTAATISDFDTQVRTSRLDQMAAPTGAVSVNSQRVTNQAAATADTDGAQWGQVKDLISGRRKADVRAVVTTNVNVSSPGSSFDGQTFSGGDTNKRLMLTGQTAPAENGIYDWTASGSALTRASDADAAAEFETGWLVTVITGSANGDTVWKNDTDAPVTVGTTAIAISKLGPISGGSGLTGYTTTCPSVSAGGTWTVTHNLGSKFLIAQLGRTASPYDIIDSVRIERTTSNTVSVLPDIALASGEYDIMIAKVA